MQFTTPVNIAVAKRQISHSDKIFCIGSCFAENIAIKLHEHGFQTNCNPWGTMYNPASVANCMNKLSQADSVNDSGDEAGQTEMPKLVFHDGLWHSMEHHGCFSHSEKSECERMVRESCQKGSQALREADIVIITFGTAWVYEREGEIVANCHKLPASEFNRDMLTIDDSVAYLKNCILTAGKQKHYILTVSPIRHLKDGLHLNQLSKSSLLLATDHAMTEMKAEGYSIDYFPSYEIMIDELRDYRFYAADMLHPSETAVEYIWQRFSDTYFSENTKEQAKRLHGYHLLLSHRPLHTDSAEYERFAQKMRSEYEKLRSSFPWIEEPSCL